MTAAERAAHYERRATRAEAKLDAIRALHYQGRRHRCAECGDKWPCLHARIVDGGSR